MGGPSPRTRRAHVQPYSRGRADRDQPQPAAPRSRSGPRSATPSSGRGGGRSRPATLPALDDGLPAVEIERPANPEHGDLATSLAMKLARPYRRAPLDIARVAGRGDRRRRRGPGGRLADRVGRGRAAGLPQPAPDRRGARRRRSARSWPTRRAGAASRPSEPRTVNVEFVSANPTGPLTVGNARGAFVGDLLCRVLEAGGQRGDARVLLQRLGRPGRATSALSVAGAPATASRVPEDGYHGDYVDELAGELPGRRLAAADAAGADAGGGSLGALGVGAGPGRHRGAASSGSASTSTSGRARARSTPRAGSSAAIERLRAGGHVYEQDGALWFRSTAFGDDKDRVIIRSERPADLLRRPTSAT